MARLEIAVTLPDDAQRAQDGGADSVEISENLALGGLTPDFGIVEAVLKTARLDVHVIVRPHAKNFHYAAEDIGVILRDTKRLACMGVKSIVFGAQDAQRRLDLTLIERVQRAAAPVPLTIHRALDESVEPEGSLEALAKMGIRRVLTAGPAANAWDGRDGLERWVSRFGAQFNFVVSGGLKIEQLKSLTAQVRAQEYHFGSAARTGGAVDLKKVERLRAMLTMG